MRYFYYDFETRITKDLRLSKMTTRAYCDATEVTMVAYALGDEEIQYHVGTPSAELLEYFRSLGEEDDVVFVAFNSSFDSRVLHYTLGLPYPKRMLCAMELSRAAWPNQPGGYSLDDLSVTLGLKYKKMKVDLETAQGEELAMYCVADVAALREIHQRSLKLVDPLEIRVCEMSNRAKRLYFEVDQDQVLAAVENMANAAGAAALEVAKAFDDDPEILKAFGWHGDVAPETLDEARAMRPKSVKPHKIKELLLDRLAIDFTKKSISLKKINPAELADMPDAGKITINKTSELNKALSYGRGLRKFSGVLTVDCELSYAAAHTLRFASRNDGTKGLNLHNAPKHNVLIAKPFRSSFRLPPGYIWVRGDFANVEYRCILEGTPVLTNNGWKKIESISSIDKVWDGVQFVDHKGVVCRGRKEVIAVHGVWMTPDHPVLTTSGWKSAEQVATSAFPSLGAYSVAGRLLDPTSRIPGAGTAPKFDASADGYLESLRPICYARYPENAARALRLAGGDIAALSATCEFAGLSYLVTRTFSPAATIPVAETTRTMAVEESRSMSPCTNETTGSVTSVPCQDMTTSASPSTGLTSTETTPPGISGSSQCLSRMPTRDEGMVYDILECGPRHRFQAGPLIVHNCEGMIAGSEYIADLFTKDLFADPYVAFGEWSTGLKIDPSTPAGKALRQIFKAAVLGLGYMMGIRTWMGQLLQVVARGDVTIQDLITLAGERRWSRMRGHTRGAVRFLGCHEIIGIVGEHVHELFHQRHPEFGKLGRWLEAAVSRLSYAHDPASALAALYELPGAPDRGLLDLFVDRTLGGSSVRARYPHWPASVCWRDLAVRETLRGPCLTSVLAGHKPPRAFTPNVAIENFVQHFARNALVKGQLELEEMGHEYQISIHDEAFILAQDNAESILKARTDMLKVFGPGNNLGYGWAININPDSVTVSRSLWDDEKWCQKQFWPRLMAGDDSVIREVA